MKRRRMFGIKTLCCNFLMISIYQRANEVVRLIRWAEDNPNEIWEIRYPFVLVQNTEMKSKL